MNSFTRLTDFFIRFPGVGSRQAKRFVYHLLTQDKEELEKFVSLVREVKNMMRQCIHCYRYFSVISDAPSGLCETCRNPQTDSSTMMIVEKDIDVDMVKKSSVYYGRFFVFGGTVPIVSKKINSSIRMNELHHEVERAAQEDSLSEIIFAFSANAEGEHTRDAIVQQIKKTVDQHAIKTTTLGRGLSTGTELEYSDEETLKNAFKNRF